MELHTAAQLGFGGQMENEKLDPRGPRAWIVAEDPNLRETLGDLARLALMRPMVISAQHPPRARRSPHNADIVLAEAGITLAAPLQDRARVTVAGAGVSAAFSSGHTCADLRIPGDEVALLQLLSSHLAKAEAGDHDPVGRVMLVGAWNGGGGATTAALRFARAAKAIYLDAAGNHGGPVPLEEGTCWESLVSADMPPPERLIAGLPRAASVPLLTHGDQAPVRPDDPRVAEVAAAATRSVVVDGGVHLDALFDLQSHLEGQGKEVTVALTGTGTESGALALGRWHAGAQVDRRPWFLLTGRTEPAFHLVSKRYAVDWVRAPRPSSNRRWKKIQERVWAGV